MIVRFPGLTPTRSRAVVHDNLIVTVAVSPDPSPGTYEQTRNALARIDESLAMCGSDKSRIMQAMLYIADITRKPEMNRAWDEWVDRKNPPMRACLGTAPAKSDAAKGATSTNNDPAAAKPGNPSKNVGN